MGKKLKSGSQASEVDSKMLSSALLECESEEMKSTILSKSHFLGKKIVKVREYMTKSQLKSHIEEIRLTRIFLKNIPSNVNNEQLKQFFTKFGKVKIAYATVKDKNPRSKKPKTGYVVFECKKIIPRLNKNGIKMGR